MFEEQLYRAAFDLEIKTVTRRISGLEELNADPESFCCPDMLHDGSFAVKNTKTQQTSFVEPLYKVGSIVYIKEPYMPTGGGIMYRYGSKRKFPTKNKMFMGGNCARQFIQIMSANVERVHQVTNLEAQLEGMGVYRAHLPGHPSTPHWYKYKFIEVWEQINGANTWDRNRWCFRYQYRVLKAEEAYTIAMAAGNKVNESWVLYHMLSHNIPPTDYHFQIPHFTGEKK